MNDRPDGSEVLIDACKPLRFLKQFAQSARLRGQTYERVAARWAELGLPDAPPALNSFHDE